MQITKNPNKNSSAFSETTSVFKVAATANEIINVDIYDHANTKIIGAKKYTGATQYDVNVGNYAKQQIEVAPMRASKFSFVYPAKRSINVNIKIGAVAATAILSSAVEQLPLLGKLSKSPSVLEIAPNQQDELTILTTVATVTAIITVIGDQKTNNFSIVNNGIYGLSTICINMKDLQAIITSIGAGDLSEYHSMKIEISDEEGYLFTQMYRFVENEPDDIRICWWNHYGQIDYYTMKKNTSNQFIVDKNRIYTASGYKTISSRAQTVKQLVSRYEDIATMEWLSEIVAAPKVWIEKGTKIIPVEILSDRITTSQENLSRLEISITDPTKTTFQTT